MDSQFYRPPYDSIIDPQHPLSQGLLAYFPLLEGGGGITYDIANHLPGSLLSGTPWSPFGMEFDGVTSYGVNYGNQAAHNLTGTKATVAILAFVKGYGQGGYGKLFSKLSASNTGYEAYVDGTYKLFTFSINNLTFANSAQNSMTTLNKWYFMLSSWNGATAQTLINDVYYSVSCGGSINSNTNNFVIGYRSHDGVRQANAIVTCIAIYKRALSMDEGMGLYENIYAPIWKPKKYWTYSFPIGSNAPALLLLNRRLRNG